MRHLLKNKGYTLIELVFYIALFAVLSFSVISALITMTKSFKETTIQAQLTVGGDVMDRLSREIRKANSITAITSTDLTLATTDDAGADKTLEFQLSGTDLKLIENSTFTGNLNTPNIAITALTFTQITTAQGKGIKVVVTIKSVNDTLARTADYNDTIVLRGGY